MDDTANPLIMALISRVFSSMKFDILSINIYKGTPLVERQYYVRMLDIFHSLYIQRSESPLATEAYHIPGSMQ